MFEALDIAGSAMNAQLLRLNTTASNMANADSVSATEAGAYRSRQPVFKAVLRDADRGSFGVQVSEITQSDAPVARRYEPGHPLANDQGYVYRSNVNAVEELANMISASRSYQSNAEVFNTSKTMLLRTLQLGQ